MDHQRSRQVRHPYHAQAADQGAAGFEDSGRLSGKMKEQALAHKEQEFRELILKTYRAEPLGGGSFVGSATVSVAPSGILPDDCADIVGRMPALPDSFFHGKTAGRLVVVCPINLPVGRLFVEEVIMECRKRGATRVDVLAFEFEMGLFPAVLEESKQKGIEVEERWTGAYIFDNEWQSFRTRRERELEMITVTHTYAKPGRYTVAIKFIDIFGNDTMTLVQVNVVKSQRIPFPVFSKPCHPHPKNFSPDLITKNQGLSRKRPLKKSSRGKRK